MYEAKSEGRWCFGGISSTLKLHLNNKVHLRLDDQKDTFDAMKRSVMGHNALSDRLVWREVALLSIPCAVLASILLERWSNGSIQTACCNPIFFIAFINEHSDNCACVKHSILLHFLGINVTRCNNDTKSMWFVDRARKDFACHSHLDTRCNVTVTYVLLYTWRDWGLGCRSGRLYDDAIFKQWRSLKPLLNSKKDKIPVLFAFKRYSKSQQRLHIGKSNNTA